MKLKRKTFIEEVKQKGFIDIGDDWIYICLPCTTENFKLSEMLEKQLKSEWKYGYYIGAIYPKKSEKPYTQDMLPIFGDPKKYVTKWFGSTFEEVISRDLRDRGMTLLKSANEFLGEV